MTLEEIEKWKSGRIADFPNEVIKKMIERQAEQGNPEDIVVFNEDEAAMWIKGGFDWRDTREGFKFWNRVITYKMFNEFFEKYPKKF